MKNNKEKIFKKRLSENKTLPKNQQIEHITHQETIQKDHPYQRTTKKLIKLEIGTCPECTCNTYCIDYHRGERVCPECGYVFNNTIYEQPKHAHTDKIQKTKFSQKDKQYLRNRNHHFVTEAKEWKQRQIQREIDVISTALELNNHTKSIFQEIISKTTLKKLHNKAHTTTILCGVARYCIKNQLHTPIVTLRYDRGIFKDNLTAQEYRIIQKNIEKLFGDTYAHSKETQQKKKRRNRKGKKHD